MKSTGVVRRIDELGRIVIPKEIRNNFDIREGENLEIFIEEDKIVLKKYSKLLSYMEIVKKINEAIKSTFDYNIIVTDREKVILNDKLSGLKIDEKLKKLIDNRESYFEDNLTKFNFAETEIFGYFCIVPIITSTDCFGLVIIYNDNSNKEEVFKNCKFIAKLIANQLDIS